MSQAPDLQAAKGFAPVRFGLVLGLLIFAAFPQIVLGLETFVARDFGFFAYPLAHFQQECFWNGELPFWNPYNNCGVPFLAQWNTMPLYPPALFYLALPLKWALSNFSLLHLWWAGIGMYFLARHWTKNDFAAAFAGTAFAFNGFTLNLLMWPSHIATFSWLPWLILTVEIALRDGGRKVILAAIVGALQMLAGGPETILLTWLTASTLALRQFLLAEIPRGKLLLRFPLIVLLVFGLSAAQLLPFLDLVAHAQRESGYTDLRWSMPGFGLVNFLVPMAFGNTLNTGIFFQHGQYWTSSYYLGLGTLLLAGLTIFALVGRDSVEPKSKLKLLIGIAVIALLCALGENTPFYPFVRKLIPQLSFITYPIKFVMLLIFAAPLLAAFALANFKTSLSHLKLAVLGGVSLVLIGGIIYWTQHSPLPGDDSAAALTNGLTRLIFLGLTLLVLFLLNRRGTSALLRFAPIGLILVTWADVHTHQPRQNPTVSPTVFEQNLVRTKLAMNPPPELGGARAMLSPEAALDLTSFAIRDPKNNFLAKRVGYCANANLLDGVPKVDGFFSLTPGDFDRLLRTIYENPKHYFSALMDFMGVAQVTSRTNTLAWEARQTFLPLVTIGQAPVFVADSPTNSPFLGYAAFDPRKVVFLPETAKNSIIVSNAANAKIIEAKFQKQSVDIIAESAEPTFVVVAQTYYHNWKATVDGAPTELLRANSAFQAIQIPSGKHQIRLTYRDDAFRFGLTLTVITMTLMSLGWWLWRKETKN